MAIQVSPMPLFDQTLRKIARTIEQNELAELAALPEPPENMQHGALGTGVERLFAALAWVLDPECYCDRSRDYFWKMRKVLQKSWNPGVQLKQMSAAWLVPGIC